MSPECVSGSTKEPGHRVVCPAKREASWRTKDEFTIDTDKQLLEFVLGSGARGPFPVLFS
jgi:hypothetical protein